MTIDPKTQARLDWLATNGICTSVTYGPSAGRGIIWSVNCLSPRFLDFDQPLQAHTFDHAVEIALMHSIKLGFIEGLGP